MTTTTKTNQTIDQFLKDITGDDRRAPQNEGRCVKTPVGCGQPVNIETDFRDPLSRREYEISGLCQSCQDEIFNAFEEEEELEERFDHKERKLKRKAKEQHDSFGDDYEE